MGAHATAGAAMAPVPGLRASSREGLRWRPPSCRYLDHVLATEDAARDVGARGRREGRRRSRPHPPTRPPSERGSSPSPRHRRRSLVPGGGSRGCASTRPTCCGRCSRRPSRGRGSWCATWDPSTQLIALAIPVLVVAAFLGMAISLLDERRLSTLIVAVSVAAFGWVTIFGPRAATPAPAPDRARCGSRPWRSTARTPTRTPSLRSVAGLKADLADRGRAVEEGPQRARADGSLSRSP